MTALYRKYRPQDFDEVVGQEAVVRTLRNAIGNDKVRQAYLFAGPRGTGKTSLARILAKGLNCEQGPTVSPDKTCNSCRTIAAGTSLDVVEMDAASQRGIDDIREIREHVILQPVEGRFKVYILDEAHQLTDAAWNALLKLIEEPPPHLVFVFCTTELSKVLPTVRSRCQTFLFSRPRLAELTKLLRRIADGEEIDVPDAALSLIARSARGSFATRSRPWTSSPPQRTGRSPCRPCSSCSARSRKRRSSGSATSSSTVTRPGSCPSSRSSPSRARIFAPRHRSPRAPALPMLVQHMGEVPESLPVTPETRERLHAQANQIGEPDVIRLVDLLAVAVDDVRQGGDPRLPLELALVKVTRPGADLSRQSLSFRIEQLEGKVRGEPHHAPAARAAPRGRAGPPPTLPPSRSRTSTSSRCSRSGARLSCPRSASARSQPRPSSVRRSRSSSRATGS